MTDEQMLLNLLAVEETMVLINRENEYIWNAWLPEHRAVIAELRRRIALEETK